MGCAPGCGRSSAGTDDVTVWSRKEENQGLVPILSDLRPGRPFPGAPGSGYLLGFRRRLGQFRDTIAAEPPSVQAPHGSKISSMDHLLSRVTPK